MGETVPLKRTGLLGGSFDPVHTGHLLIARDAMEGLALEEVFFVPAARAPLRSAPPVAAAHHRKAMLNAAAQDEPAYRVLDSELNAGGTSYTIDTARCLHHKHPGRHFFWILGGDQLAKLEHWKDAAELCRLLEFIVLERPGHPLPEPPPIPGLRCHKIRGHLFSISSTEIRERLSKNLSVREFLPHKVHSHIEENDLYKN